MEARTELFILMSTLYAERRRGFGNGRVARNVFEACQEHMAERLKEVRRPSRAELTTVLPEDIPPPGRFLQRSRPEPEAGGGKGERPKRSAKQKPR